MLKSLALPLALCAASILHAQPQRGSAAAAAAAQAQAAQPSAPATPIILRDEKPVVTSHVLRAGGRELAYKATTGYMPLVADNGTIDASLFYVAYTLDPAPPAPQRPLTVCFNGGPGAGSLWLHLGAIGPKRVKMLDDGALPPPPYELIDNEATWLDKTDLVFVDPVGTGFSRATSPDVARRFFGLNGDIESVGRFIRLYLSRNQRWNSPLFLAGESYGTTRAAGLSGYLSSNGISLNGVMLVSTILNFQTARFAPGNDLPYSLFLPTYTAIAWYHKRLPADLQKDLAKAVAESREYASGEYTRILQAGDALSSAERAKAIDKLARLTGLDKRYIDLAGLRIEIQRFCKELLRDERKTVGRLDARLTALESGVAERPEFDPSEAAIRGPYTATMNTYAREALKFETDREYYALGGGITGAWDWNLGPGGQGYPNTAEPLRLAMTRNPYMKVFVAYGYYDLATPFHAAEYTMRHLGIDASLRANIREAYYEAGHMMYIHKPSLAKLKKDVDGFYDFALKR